MRSNARLLLTLLAGLAVHAGTPAAARADERSIAREHFERGRKQFDLGRYDAAISEYSAAYEIKDDPALLYNIAQAHRLAGHAAAALQFYRRYLAREPRSPQRSEVEVKIAELQHLIDQQARTETLPPNQTLAPEETRPKVVEPAPAPRVTAPPVAVTAPPAPPRRPGAVKKMAGMITGIAGVALVGVGIAFAALAQQSSDDLTRLDRNMQVYDPGKYSAGQTDQALGATFLVIGGVAVAGGATLYMLGYRDAHRTAARDTAAALPFRF
jgi:tetratricopeptide (TPR) repeat protein